MLLQEWTLGPEVDFSVAQKFREMVMSLAELMEDETKGQVGAGFSRFGQSGRCTWPCCTWRGGFAVLRGYPEVFFWEVSV
jgi:hypothetical protein